MKKFLISSVVAATLLATVGSAANIAVDNTGEYLIGGKYFAYEGFSTNVKLVNTNLTKSVVLRFLARSFDNSNEVDVIVTLSPGDVWEGQLKYTKDNTSGQFGPTLVSTDESNLDVNSPDNPISKGINMNVKNTKGEFSNGYIEVYPMFAYDHTVSATDGVEISDIARSSVKEASVVPKTAKNGKFSLYDMVWAVTKSIGADTNTNTFQSKAGGFSYQVPALTVVGPDDVYGEVTISNTNFKPNFTTSLPMLAVENVDPASTLTALTTYNHGYLKNMQPAQNTISTQYFSQQAIFDIYSSLYVKSVTVPYANSGDDQKLYFSWWLDNRGEKVDTKAKFESANTLKQSRSFYVALRGMAEERPLIKEYSQYVSPPPPKKETARSYVSFESGSLDIASLIKSVKVANANWNHTAGMIKLVDFQDETNVLPLDNKSFVQKTLENAPSTVQTQIAQAAQSAGSERFYNKAGIVTYQQAIKNSDGNYSVTWTYPAVERLRITEYVSPGR